MHSLLLRIFYWPSFSFIAETNNTTNTGCGTKKGDY